MKRQFKAALSVLLVVSLLFSVLGIVSVAADGDELKIFVASDIHYRTRESQGSLEDAIVTVPGSEMYFYADYMGKMFYESEAIVRSLLNDFEASDSDILIITGDMVNDGDIDAHESIAAILREFEQRTGKTIYLLPGNHDVLRPESENPCTLDDFKRIYADFGYNEALAKDENSSSYTVDLSPEYRLIVIDSNDYGEVPGDVSESTYTWVSQQVAQADADGVHLIGAMHHSLLEHFTLQNKFSGGFDTYGIEKLATSFADWGIKYVLTGHLHVTDITMATTDKGNKIYDVATGSLISASNAYRVITFSDDSVDIDTRNISTIDPQYLVDGYTDEQKNLLVNDFQTYSSEYCAAGLHYWVDSFLCVEKLAQSLNLKEGTLAYDAVDTMMGYVRKAVNLPLYDRVGTEEVDSLSEVAALAGYSIPESDYDYALDIAAIYVLSFFSGNPSVTSDSLETSVLLAALKGAIAYAIGQMIDNGECTKELYALFTALGMKCDGLASGNVVTTEAARLTYMQTAANSIIKTAIAPVLDSLSYDAYAPADLDVTLEPYSADRSFSLTGDGGQPITFLQKLIAFLKLVFAMLKDGLSFLYK